MMILKTQRVVQLCICLTFLTHFSSINAATLKGKILDASSSEPLTGAIIYNKQYIKLDDEARLDGGYVFKKLSPGKYTFVIQFMGYESQEREIEIISETDVISINFLLQEKHLTLQQIEVVGVADKESALSARNTELKSDNLINVTAAKTIQLSPDITVANVLQRMSGVTVQRTANSGEGQYAIIRGMDKRYNTTQINGVKIPSPNDKNRYVPMDIFPSDIIASLEVIKALTPDMEGDAIGGVMNLVMKDAPDKLLVSGSASVGYNKLFMDRPFYQYDAQVVSQKSPAELYGSDYHAKISDFPTANLVFNPIQPRPNLNGSFSIGNRFFERKLGVILSVSNQNNFSGSDAFMAFPRTKPNPGNMPGFETRDNLQYSLNQNRLGIHNKFDFNINQYNKISMYNVYFELDKYISKNTIETSLGTGVGNVVNMNRSQTQFEKLYSSTLSGKHIITETLKADWTAAYSIASANYPDDVELQYNSTVIDKPLLQSLNHKWRHNNDADLSGYANLSWKPLNEIELKVGGMYRHKNRDNYYNQYKLDPVQINGTPQLYNGINNAVYAFSGTNADMGSLVNQNDYNVTENVLAYYGMGKFTLWQKLNIIAGVRVEETDLNWLTPMPITFVGRSGIKSYSDMLPSINLKYSITDVQNLRLSYYTSLSRPSFFELIPYDIEGPDGIHEVGNPYLKPAHATNFDLRYELFPHPLEQLFVGVFYKNITDPITSLMVSGPQWGTSTFVIQPQNNPNPAINYGLELQFIKYFGEFGVSANYSYTHSEMKVLKSVYGLDFQTTQVTSTIPMQGQVDHLGNLSVLYKNQKIGLDMQLSLVYTGMFVSVISTYDGLDYWTMPSTNLDFSFEKKFGKSKNLAVFGKARNLLNTLAKTEIRGKGNSYFSPGAYQLPYQDDPNAITVQLEAYKQNFLIGIRYNL
jgi:outer membrane receptor protein involved in Fe transport